MAEQGNAGTKQESLNKRLFEAARKGDVEGIQNALDAGANVNAPSDRTEDAKATALQLAVLSGNEQAVKALLDVPGIDLTIKGGGGEGRTALEWARSLEPVVYDPKGKVPLSRQAEFESIVNMLQDAEDKPQRDRNERLFEAANIGDVEGIKKALERGADVNAKSDDKNYLGNPLHRAIIEGHPEAVDALLKVPGIDVNGKEGINGFTPLALAAHLGDVEMTKKLLADPRVDLDAKDGHGRTALDLARTHAEKDPKYKPVVEALEKAAEKRAGMGKSVLKQDGRENEASNRQGATSNKRTPQEAAVAATNGLRLPHGAADYENKPSPSVPSGPNSGRGVA